MDRRQLILGSAAGLAAGPIWAQETDILADQSALVTGGSEAFFAALERIKARNDISLVPGLILALRFTRAPSELIVNVLSALTGEEKASNWFDWMLWQEAHPEIIPHPSYAQFKRGLYLGIDRNFADFLRPEYLTPDAMRIRLEEITWGGVIKDGIPSLDNPKLVKAEQASYLRDDDLIFGVSINGDVRAYPLRVMGWHEMFNEVIGGVPVALAYCTLCGSGILFETQVAGRRKPLVFGSSGFLYRSNKLMFDRATHSLWNQFTGKPVVGRLVGSGIELSQRPVVITSWAEWRKRNPTSKVLSLDTGHKRDYGSGVVYQNYFSSDDLMFPTNVDQSKHKQKSFVFGVREYGGAKAWPLTVFAKAPIINDAIGTTPLVLFGDAVQRSVRAYERGAYEFKQAGAMLRSGDGQQWQITEEALVSQSGEQLPRVAGHIAFWFAWNGYLSAQSEVYGD